MRLFNNTYIFESVSEIKDLSDDFNALTNKEVWEKFYSFIADTLSINKIPLENIFFVNTPAFVVLISEIDKAIIQKSASYYTKYITRDVIIEKNKSLNKRFRCYFDIERKPGDKIISRPLSVMTIRINWKKSINEFDSMKALCEYVKAKSNLPIFLYVDASFFENLQNTQTIRVATLTNDFIV